jgi:hypothetical protein
MFQVVVAAAKVVLCFVHSQNIIAISMTKYPSKNTSQNSSIHHKIYPHPSAQWETKEKIQKKFNIATCCKQQQHRYYDHAWS